MALRAAPWAAAGLQQDGPQEAGTTVPRFSAPPLNREGNRARAVRGWRSSRDDISATPAATEARVAASGRRTDTRRRPTRKSRPRGSHGEPDNAFTTEELCERAYPLTVEDVPERAQRIAVLRAVKSLARHRPDLGVKAWKAEMARGKLVVFHRRYRVLSYAMARLKGDVLSFKVLVQSETELRAMLAPVVGSITGPNRAAHGCFTLRWPSQSATETTRRSNGLRRNRRAC